MSADSSHSVATLRTLHGEIPLDAALDAEYDMVQDLSYWNKRIYFLAGILDRSAEIEAVVSYHLGLTQTGNCSLAPLDDWVDGSFNICIPVHVKNWNARPESRVMIRFPLPYKVGEENCPGNAEEKLRCEAATYIWIQENCPGVPIPRLLGFSFGGNQCFTSLGTIPWHVRLLEYFRRQLRSLFCYPPQCPFLRRRQPHSLEPGYLLLEYIEEDQGVMLSESWEEKRQDKGQRTNLFRDLSRIILSLGRIPLARIGSFTLDNAGVLSLSNRPLTLRLQELENRAIPINISRGDTYTAVEPYVLDLLAYHESRLRYQPNSINDGPDCRGQMAAITGMRAVLPHFIDRDLRNGPFLFTLTDIRQCNIFVDEQWHIKYLIDLEWACSLPVQMQNCPYWLTSKDLDHLTGEPLADYEKVREEFMEAFEYEEKLLTAIDDLPRTRVMKRTWETGSFFYFHALDSTIELFNIWAQNIQPRFSDMGCVKDEINRIVSPYWCADSESVVVTKMKDREEYLEQLRALFKTNSQIQPPTKSQNSPS